jgi:membrane protease YdiL (CAAX protease family)
VTGAVAVRCQGCGAPNIGERRACLSCGTLLPLPSPIASAEPVVHAAASAPEALHAAALSSARVAGVARLFSVCLGLSAAFVVANRWGAPAAISEVVESAVLALVAVLCAASARAEIRPLLTRTDGWRGLAAAGAGLTALVAFGAIYFPLFGWLGMTMASASAPFRAIGWPRWSIYLLVSLLPAIFEELTFRGYVMARLTALLTARETLLVQAALFALLHLGVVIFPSHFFIGLVLGSIRQRTRSLYPGMLVHASWNALVVWCERAGPIGSTPG